MPPAGEERPWDPATRWRGLWVICAAMVVSAIDMTIVNVALPDISRDLGATFGQLQWVLDGFLVALGGMLTVGSGLADRFGRRRAFLSGLAGFGVASVLCALAPSATALIAGRVLMGIAAAFVLPPALSLLTVMFEPAERPRALGIWTMAAGLAMAAGPLLGGALVSLVGWPGVFLVNVPVVAVAIPAGIRLLPESRRPGTPPLDLVGAGLSAVALTALVFFLVEGDRAGWTAPRQLVVLALGLAAGGAFVARELRARHPLLDVRIFCRPRVTGGTVAVVALYASFMGVMFLIPQYLQYVQERSPFTSGLAMFPVGVGVGLAPIFGRWAPLARMQRGTAMAGGLALAALGCLTLLPFADDTPLPFVGAGMLLFGAAFGFAIVPATATIMNDLTAEQAGDGSATNQLARQVGGALGVASVGSLSAAVYAADVRDRLGDLGLRVRETAERSIAHAEHAAAVLPSHEGAFVLAAGDGSFDAGARAGLLLAATALLLAAVVVAATVRPEAQPDPAGAPEPAT